MRISPLVQDLNMMKEVSFQDGRSKSDLPSENLAKQYKERDLAQTYFYKIAARTFGPPKSRRRIIMAPLMEKALFNGVQITHAPETRQRRAFQGPVCEAVLPTEREPSQMQEEVAETTYVIGDCRAWISQRKTCRAELDNFGNVETWLKRKPVLTELEGNVLDKLEALHHLTDSPTQEEANIPLSDSQLDDLVVFLGAKDADSINYKELVVGRRLWKHESLEGQQQLKKLKSGLSGQSMSIRAYEVASENNEQPLADPPRSVSSSHDRSSVQSPVSLEMRSSSARRSMLLELPPINLEEGRPLTYEDMEEIGKMYRERRRKGKSNTRLLDLVDQCRTIQSGNIAVDKHSLPSTLDPEFGDAVDRFRRAVLIEYMAILKLCRKYNVPLSEELLEKALLYPGDKPIKSLRNKMKLKQPGTFPLSPIADWASHSLAGTGLRPTPVMPHLRPGAEMSDLLSDDEMTLLPPRPGTSSCYGTGKSLSSGMGVAAVPFDYGTSISSSDAFQKYPENGQSKGKSKLRTIGGLDQKDPQFSSSYPPKAHARKDKTRDKKCWTTFEEYRKMSRIVADEIAKQRTTNLTAWSDNLKGKLSDIACSVEDLKHNPERVKRKLKELDWILTLSKAQTNKLTMNLPPTFNRLNVPIPYCSKFPSQQLRKFFMRARFNLLLTREILAIRSSSTDTICRLCHNLTTTESIKHLLLRCPMVRKIRATYLSTLVCEHTSFGEEEELMWWNRLMSGEKTRWTIATVKILESAFEMISSSSQTTNESNTSKATTLSP
ncbi:EF-hand calcium-binding domain-containing protein 12 isoform X2 [Ambystoma mexicanum]|uniref:EF-hand calcium-binding domain-containing protein 12 isoform X2 n=1 Tax=Ambystoma mexicanum TaxID=8296 RepID=UPI0037E83DED